jgi:LacI family transcriptional regulator
MAVTLKDIAHRAKVTSATVSMVINNKPNISDDTRRRVLKIARELNYYPNAIARGLATSKANAVGVIVPNLASSYVVRILQGIKSTNRDIDYTVQLFDTIGQKETESQLFQRLARERRIDGAILIGAVCPEQELSVFKDEHVPCIVVARKCDILDSVYVNNAQGSQTAVDFLIRKGHRRIGCVVCHNKTLPTQERLEGYRTSLHLNNIPFDPALIFDVPDDKQSDGEAVFAALRDSPLKPTAAFVPAGDMVAIGIIKAAKRSGLRVPRDMAVVGFDDIPAAEVVEPELTTVRQPKLEMGDLAINLCIDKIEGRESGIRHRVLLTKLIVRESA